MLQKKALPLYDPDPLQFRPASMYVNLSLASWLTTINVTIATVAAVNDIKKTN
jgi:hypothetical protein